MLELKDFFHLPQVDKLLKQLVTDQPGLVIVAGLDPRLVAGPDPKSRLLPSGRSTFFGILVRQLLAAHRTGNAVVVAAQRDPVRIPNAFRRRVKSLAVKDPLGYADQIENALTLLPEILIVDQLDKATATAALQVARRGVWVVSQLDCVFRGPDVARYLLDLGVPSELMEGLNWVITVQRFPTLCNTCKQPVQPDPVRVAEWRRRFSDLALEGPFYHASGCETCDQTGRVGDVAIFDVLRNAGSLAQRLEQPSLLSMQEYALRLANLGYVSLDDVERLEAEQLRRTYLLLTASEQALRTTNVELHKRLAELEAAHRVMKQRTDSLVSLEDIARSLITLTELNDLANRISHLSHKLCGADRSVLYLLLPDGAAQVLSVSGWDPSFVHQKLDGMQVFGDPVAASDSGSAPTPYLAWPPGIPPRHADVEGAVLRAGLRVPLIAQNEVVGLMIVHSTHKASFTAGEMALLQTFANQAALAIQRTGLVQALRDKIDQLQAAQAELVKKERLERELELAREVQQSLLPRTFPHLPGYRFAARNETARRVGGDFYDIFRLDATHFGIVIADVSDKGMPAALFMALTRSLLLAEARRELSPRNALGSVHQLLLDLGSPEMFVTVFYGVIEMSSRQLAYSRAGHEEPLLLRAGALSKLEAKGGFLGLIEGQALSLSEEHINLQPGDRLVLYTDGLIDALAPSGEPYGRERLERFLRTRAELGPEELCKATFDELTAFQGPAEQFDDMALLIVAVE